MIEGYFEWDKNKDKLNQERHNVDFSMAKKAFSDSLRVIARDDAHSQDEERFYCFGMVDDDVLTVRFTYRGERIRIIGAGYWRKGKAIYEQENRIHG
jgi:uncharacterized protein